MSKQVSKKNFVEHKNYHVDSGVFKAPKSKSTKFLDPRHREVVLDRTYCFSAFHSARPNSAQPLGQAESWY